MSEVFTNLATTTISGTLSDSATSVTVAAADGGLFPNPTGSEFFRVVMIKLSTGQYEIAKVTSRTGDVLSFGVIGNRGIEGTSALGFNDGDIIELRPTAAFFGSLLTDADMQENKATYAADTGSANAYVVTLSPAVTAYAAGLELKFKASNTNTGASTLNVNGVGATAIKRDQTFDVEANDIQNGDIVHVIHDGTYWQMRVNNRKNVLYLDERAAAPATRTNSVSLFSQDVSTVTGLFARPDGGAAHQIPFPYDTVMLAEWGAAPAGWELQSVVGEQIPLITDDLTVLGDSSQSLVDSYAESNGDGNVPLNNTNNAVGQSFTGDGSDLDFVTFQLQKVASPTGNIVAKLYAHTGTFGTSGTPTGTALATSETIDVSTLSTSLTLVNFFFDSNNQYTLVNATNYFIVVEYTNGDATNYVNVRQDTSSPTHGGNKATYTTSWSASSTEDLCFYVNGGNSWASTGLTVDGHSLIIAELAAHQHSMKGRNTTGGNTDAFSFAGAGGSTSYPATTATGDGDPHDHDVTVAPGWRPPYTYMGRFKYTG